MAEYHRFSEKILKIQGEVDAKRSEAAEIRQNIEDGENESVRLNGQAEKSCRRYCELRWATRASAGGGYR